MASDRIRTNGAEVIVAGGRERRALEQDRTGFAAHHGPECTLDAVPTLVAIHGVVAATDACNVSSSELTHLLLKLLDVSGAARGQRVTAIHKRMHEEAIDSVLLGHAQQCVEMVLVRMDAAV